MPDLIPIKKSHIKYYNNFPLYYISKNGEALLYKNADKKLDKDLLERNQYPQFFIHKEDKVSVVEKLQRVLNIKLARAISSKGLYAIKKSLCNIVEEALSGPLGVTLESLPETIEILFYGVKKNSDLLDALTAINNKSSKVVEHSVNVLALTAQYCFFKRYSEEQIKTFCLCALLHDFGSSKIDKKIIETKEKLTDKEYSIYKTHTIKGFREIELYPTFDKSIGITALEHHERLDGSGYPHGIKQISFEAQLVGLIDSYEALKYQDKTFRKALKPYDALQIIKTDVVAEKYNKAIFVDLCSCLIK
ncbi:metal-dependent phosphohydrolase [Desulfobacula toluolica Tol2]|uniref:Metal-dependent phosphohydrolase n=2 Tax=Desulfobacula toluolica TaxID=28223 RepID=K0NSU5_DESTT|nr:metal-dependent phosphohydrolase [Desulfobacula toluolica Tol2]